MPSGLATVIVLDMSCRSSHRFEGWFASAEAFEQQLAQKLIACPHCDSTDVHRLPSPPSIAKNLPRGPSAATETELAVEALIGRLRELGERSEDVGQDFPEKARRMHFHEIESRPIKGLASGEELRDLVEEGVPVLPIPKKKTNH